MPRTQGVGSSNQLESMRRKQAVAIDSPRGCFVIVAAMAALGSASRHPKRRVAQGTMHRAIDRNRPQTTRAKPGTCGTRAARLLKLKEATHHDSKTRSVQRRPRRTETEPRAHDLR